MTINPSKGNMYPDVVTWNGMYGICSHNCLYCYNRIHWIKWGKMRLNERALKDNLGSDKFIFVGSSCDMFAVNIPSEWIEKVLDHCRKFDNTYLFQTKNPGRFKEFEFPKKVFLGTTIESNRDYKLSKAPKPRRRAIEMMGLECDTMLSVEPILDFDVDIMVRWIKEIQPEFVSIGADSKNHELKEPKPDKVNKLIKELKKFTSVRIKDNLKRLTIKE